MVQQLLTAQQAYVHALTELRKQLGLPQCAVSAIPVGELRIPQGAAAAEEEDLTRIALQGNAEISVPTKFTLSPEQFSAPKSSKVNRPPSFTVEFVAAIVPAFVQPLVELRN